MQLSLKSPISKATGILLLTGCMMNSTGGLWSIRRCRLYDYCILIIISSHTSNFAGFVVVLYSGRYLLFTLLLKVQKASWMCAAIRLLKREKFTNEVQTTDECNVVNINVRYYQGCSLTV